VFRIACEADEDQQKCVQHYDNPTARR
jgi:hypothetical protein